MLVRIARDGARPMADHPERCVHVETCRIVARHRVRALRLYRIPVRYCVAARLH